MTAGDRGLGLYADETCYDPNRPAWLPNFIDTPTESACFYNSGSILGQMGGVVGYGAAQVAGGVVKNLLTPTGGDGIGTIAILALVAVLVMRR